MLPDEKSTSKPFLGTATSPISLPYVPPLANTFASTNVNTIPMVPNTGKSDAEIVFAGVANMNLNNEPSNAAPLPTVPSVPTEQQQQPITQQQSNSSSEGIAPVGPQVPAVTIEKPVPIATTNVTYQHASVFGTVPPTSIPSLNESFNIPPTIDPISVPAPVYQPTPAMYNQGRKTYTHMYHCT